MLYFMGGDFDITTFVMFIIVAFFAFAYHELGHALVADYLGDMTPRQYGRITLNPFPHISWFGLIMLILIGFGWATTPINEGRMRGNPRMSHAIVAIAGPAVNLLMAFLFAIPLRLFSEGFVDYFSLIEAGVPFDVIDNALLFCTIGVRLNLFLIAFNLLPIPPLDGFWVLRGFLPPELAIRWEGLYRYSMIIFLVVIFLLPQTGLSIFPAINEFTNYTFALLTGL